MEQPRYDDSMRYILTKNDRLFGSQVVLTEEEIDAIIDEPNRPLKPPALQSAIRKLITLRDHKPGGTK